MRKILLDFYDVLDELIPEERTGMETGGKPGDRTGEKEPEVFLADVPENRVPDCRELVHRYLEELLLLPEGRIRTLSDLYDALTEIGEPTAVGFFLPVPEFDELSLDLMMYLDRVRETFLEAERDNRDCLAVIVCEGGAGFDPEEDPDEALDELLGKIQPERMR